MKNFQTKLDVIGNNIANVNTYGFKKGRVNFKDLVSQSIAGASAPGELLGGVNPKQVGLGAQLGTIDTIDTQGSLQTTGRSLDLAISGDGYFVLIDSAGENPTYTRSGNFYLDSQGMIVNADGKFLQGDGGAITIPTEAKSFSIGSDGVVSYVDEDGELETAGQIIIAKIS